MADKIKLVVAAIIVALGIAGFYYFSADYSLLVRVIGLLVMFGLAIVLALQTAVGRLVLEYFKESRTEVRKVVWPTRKETSTTTIIIFISVVIVGLVLWGLDAFLLWAVQLLTRQGS